MALRFSLVLLDLLYPLARQNVYPGPVLKKTKHIALTIEMVLLYKTCVKRPLSNRQKIGFKDRILLNAGQKYFRMLQVEHSAILSTFIKLPFVIKPFVFVYFEWQLYTGFTVLLNIYKTLVKQIFDLYTIVPNIIVI